MIADPTLPVVVATLEALGIRLWRWPNGSLGAWPPAPWPLTVAMMALKPALLDLVDAWADRGDAQPPEWARTPDEEGWYSPPELDEQVRFPPGGGYQIRLKPGAQAALEAELAAQAARWETLSPEARARLAEGCLSDDVEPRFPDAITPWEL